MGSIKRQVSDILIGLRKNYPDAECALNYRTPLELLIATILSAQCTDVRVNIVTPALFRKYPSPSALARAPLSNIEKMIYSTGFYRSKARNIKNTCSRLVQEFGSEVPKSMEQLLRLPGVARKTANVVLGTAYGVVSGVVVDTHVYRITHRLGLTTGTTPEKVENDLMRLIPSKEWINFSHRVIHHGRQVCLARNPRCDICVLEKQCHKIGVRKKTQMVG